MAPPQIPSEPVHRRPLGWYVLLTISTLQAIGCACLALFFGQNALDFHRDQRSNPPWVSEFYFWACLVAAVVFTGMIPMIAAEYSLSLTRTGVLQFELVKSGIAMVIWFAVILDGTVGPWHQDEQYKDSKGKFSRQMLASAMEAFGLMILLVLFGLNLGLAAIWWCQNLEELLESIQAHKLSMVCMLNIVQCQFMQDAESSMNKLMGLVEDLVASNADLRLRLDALAVDHESVVDAPPLGAV
ncbi:hypothetical protein EJ04DRAFT_579461 [Polyplosphaeria fusca]|uniref:Uncharacterized protein n=1 Tax=Polyplosphaeria fusca TaxID=682080 RepID=A0A9P4QU21_9PLEO|nr:hypothetical protein EJ04DRAFT_579461 [Polyplosphaeria fusca]